MSPARILVVKDDPGGAGDIERQLRRIGHELIGIASSGQRAVELAEREQPQLVLMDIRLEGELDAIEATRRIRERCHIPIIYLTASADDEMLARASDAEPVGYLLEPYEDSRLRTALDLALYEHAAGCKRQGCERPETKQALREANERLEERLRQAKQLAEAAPSSAPALNVLVAEDNPFNAELMDRLLRKLGHSVRLAPDGRQCLAALENGGVDLVLLDLHMPELDGFQVVQELRERERALFGYSGSSLSPDRVPVIAVTARVRAADRELCLAAGMDDVLLKPVPPAELAAAIERVRRAARGRHELLSANVLLSACGRDPEILAGICSALHAQLPDSLRVMRQALSAGDAAALCARAHRSAGMLSAFSTRCGELASGLEDHASAGDLAAAGAQLERLALAASDLLLATRGLSIEQLERSLARAEPARRLADDPSADPG